MNILDHLEKLPLMLVVSQTGSFRQAALRLNISQPAVTRSLRILEDACGGELFKRTQRGVTLTPRGYSVLAMAKEIDDCVNRHASRLETFDSKVHGKIEIGTYESIAIYYWPAILRALQLALPNVQVLLRTGRSEDLERSLVKGEFDLIVTVEPTKRRGVINVELYRDHFELYALDEIALGTINTSILFEDAVANFSAEIREAFRRNGIHARRKVATDSLEVVRAMTLAGVGVGVMPTRVASAGLSSSHSRTLRALTAGSLKKVSEHVIAASFLASRQEHPTINSIVKIVQSSVAAAGR